MQFFVQYLTVQIVLTEKTTSLITVFPQLLKTMANKAWHFRKWEGKSRWLEFSGKIWLRES